MDRFFIRLFVALLSVMVCFGGKAGKPGRDYATPRSGQAKWVSPKGNIYEGRWRDGDLPRGKVTMADGVYEGDLKDLILDGYGVMTYRNGDVYRGQWRGGHKNGLGRFEKKNGRIDFGHWKNGKQVVQKGKRFRHEDFVYGIDLSHHQQPGRIDWKRLAIKCDEQGNIGVGKRRNQKFLHPVSFVYVRAVFGTKPDKTFKTHVANARRHGVSVGAYHFFSIYSDVDSQIETFKKAYKREPGDLPPVLDLENEKEGDLKGYERALRRHGVKKMQNDVLKWLKAIEKHYGVKPVVYTRESWMRDFLDNRQIKSYPLWLARYHNVRPRRDDWIFWQMSDNVFPTGYNSNIDVNRFNGNNGEFVKYLNKQK